MRKNLWLFVILAFLVVLLIALSALASRSKHEHTEGGGCCQAPAVTVLA